MRILSTRLSIAAEALDLVTNQPTTEHMKEAAGCLSECGLSTRQIAAALKEAKWNRGSQPTWSDPTPSHVTIATWLKTWEGSA